MFGEDVCVYDLVEMFLVEIVDREAARNAEVRSVRPGDIVIEGDAEENIHRFRCLGKLTEERAIIARYPGAAFVCRIDQNDQWELAGIR